ncbi:MAG TPA: hypothetical protein VL284_00840 [Thermoanaerobaculia bacterium]|nr:hypothetical protein [Thermoanaerobaculia bacterium]
MSNRSRILAAAALGAALATGAFAQVTPAAGYTPPNDNPSFKVGATIFADYTYQDSPETKDADGNTINPSSFNVSRAYINFLGTLNHLVSFRITPDITRESGSGSSLNGSYTFRLKYAFGQLNLDDWTTHGSWLRFGLQQTPWIDYAEGIYRYRFQGPTFVDREGLLASSDLGFSGHYNFAGNYGDIHAGVYNGEGYNHPEANNEKSFQVRATLRPLPLGGAMKGLRISGYADIDHYVESGKKQRYLGQVSYESPWVNAAVEYVDVKDRTSVTKTEIDGRGYSVWATPKFGGGWEALLRHDDFKPNSDASLKRKRDIAGIAYWFPHMSGVQTALLADYDSTKQSGVTPAPPKTTLYGIKMLVNF